MPKKCPKLVAINRDDYKAEFVGKTKTGRQFFLTTPFVPQNLDRGIPGCEYVALYLFDAKGVLVDTQIESFGPRATLDRDARNKRHDEMLETLGEITFRRIRIAPFEIEQFGIKFGLIAQLTDDGENWQVIVEPGNYMCFWSPWTSGVYDT